MNTIKDIFKNDDLNLLSKLDDLYGVSYKGSYWTGTGPYQALESFFTNFPRYRITKEITVIKLDRVILPCAINGHITMVGPTHKG